MDDLISRQAAIDEIDEWIKAFLENGHKESAADACLIQDGIFQLPSVQPDVPDTNVGDMISRQAAIGIVQQARIETMDYGMPSLRKIEEEIETIPSAQPTPCDVCRHNPPSSMGGKPCCMCPAEGREE